MRAQIDVAYDGEGKDLLNLNGGNDYAGGGSEDDIINGGTGDDTALGGAGNDSLLGGDGHNVLKGEAGKDACQAAPGTTGLMAGKTTTSCPLAPGQTRSMAAQGKTSFWGGNWSSDGAHGVFVHTPGGGRDQIIEFEVQHDMIDLSAYGLTFEDLAGRITEKGGATEIDLSGLAGAGTGNALVLKAVKYSDLSFSNLPQKARQCAQKQRALQSRSDLQTAKLRTHARNITASPGCFRAVLSRKATSPRPKKHISMPKPRSVG